jgi:galacturonosyltransferase
LKNNIVNNNYAILSGSGVNLEQFTVSDLPSIKNKNIMFICWKMGIKGIDQYLECAKFIIENNPQTTFYVAGFLEEGSYEQIINEYHKRGVIEYIGFQEGIKSWKKMPLYYITFSLGGRGTQCVIRVCCYG